MYAGLARSRYTPAPSNGSVSGDPEAKKTMVSGVKLHETTVLQKSELGQSKLGSAQSLQIQCFLRLQHSAATVWAVLLEFGHRSMAVPEAQNDARGGQALL